MYWFNYNLSVAIGVGFIALAGVAVETGMVLLNYLNLALKNQIELAKASKRNLTIQDIIELFNDSPNGSVHL